MSQAAASGSPTPYAGPIPVSAYDLAERFAGEGELPGGADNPAIRWFLAAVGFGPQVHDEVPWCAAFVSRIAWLLFLPRSTSPAARSWLTIGTPVDPASAQPGFDVVVLSRGALPQPPASVLAAQGHVGFFGGLVDGAVLVLGGNQGDRVSISKYPVSRILGIRRLRAMPAIEPPPADVRRSLGGAA